MAGGVPDLPVVAAFHDAALVHHHDTVGDVAHHGQVVRDEEVGQAEVPLQFHQQVQYLCLHRHVERGNGFVQHHQGGPHDQGARNAYALALSSSDDRATIVWTNEIADAWAVAAPLLRAGDKFGARQAFVEAYGRITGEARALRQHPVVQVSLGHDPEGRTRALQEAMTAGRLPGGLEALTEDVRHQLHLPAPRAALALPAPESAPAGPERSTLQQLAKLREHFARKAGRFTHAQVLARADRIRLNQEKRKTAAAVQAYQQGGAA